MLYSQNEVNSFGRIVASIWRDIMIVNLDSANSSKLKDAELNLKGRRSWIWKFLRKEKGPFSFPEGGEEGLFSFFRDKTGKKVSTTDKQQKLRKRLLFLSAPPAVGLKQPQSSLLVRKETKWAKREPFAQKLWPFSNPLFIKGHTSEVAKYTKNQVFFPLLFLQKQQPRK